MDLTTAFERIQALLPPPRVAELPLGEALGTVLARDVRAPHPLPPFPRSAMDGYALRAADVGQASARQPVRLRLTGRVEMGRVPAAGPAAGEAWAIPTGGSCPPGADAVVQREWTRLRDGHLEVLRPVRAGQNVDPIGEDVTAGEVVLTAGRVLGPAELGMAAALGLERLAVVPRPRVALLSTGDELLAPGQPAEPGRVYNSNRVLLEAELRLAGAEPLTLGIAPDREEDLEAAFRRALELEPDAVLTTGGVSVGEQDLVGRVWQRLGAEFVVRRLPLKPGGPVFVGRLDGVLVACLSGNPAACITTYHLLVRPALLRLAGRRQVVRPLVPCRLADGFPKAADVTRALWARLEGEGPPYLARLTPTQRPGALSGLLQANGLLLLAKGSAPLEPGDPVWALHLGRPEEGETFRLPQRPPWPGGLPAISVVGPSEAGKTALAERLLAAWRLAGLRVAAVKHAAHGFEVRVPSQSDGERLARAGALATAVAGPGGLLLREPGQPDLEEVLTVLARRRGFDLVLVEGYKAGPLPKVEVLGPEGPQPLRGVVARFAAGDDAQALAGRLLEVLGLRPAS